MLEPDATPRGFVQRFLERSGPGIHHVTFDVESLADACERAACCGYDIVGRSQHASGWKEAFLHPTQAQGIVVQLAESPESAHTAPAAPAEPEAVRLVALRMRAGAAERARRQWGELLGGECAGQGDELRFRWPDSPIQLLVRIEADAKDGSEALEIAARRPVALPSGPHPLLGARFRRAPA